MWRDEREMMAAEAQAEFEADEDDLELDPGDDDWQPGCDSVLEGGYDPLTDW